MEDEQTFLVLTHPPPPLLAPRQADTGLKGCDSRMYQLPSDKLERGYMALQQFLDSSPTLRTLMARATLTPRELMDLQMLIADQRTLTAMWHVRQNTGRGYHQFTEADWAAAAVTLRITHAAEARDEFRKQVAHVSTAGWTLVAKVLAAPVELQNTTCQPLSDVIMISGGQRFRLDKPVAQRLVDELFELRRDPSSDTRSPFLNDMKGSNVVAFPLAMRLVSRQGHPLTQLFENIGITCDAARMNWWLRGAPVAGYLEGCLIQPQIDNELTQDPIFPFTHILGWQLTPSVNGGVPVLHGVLGYGGERLIPEAPVGTLEEVTAFMTVAGVRFQQGHMLDKMYSHDTVRAYADARERPVKHWTTFSLQVGKGMDRLEDPICSQALQTLDRYLFAMGHNGVFPAGRRKIPEGYADDLRVLYAVATRDRAPPPSEEQIKTAVENYLKRTKKFFSRLINPTFQHFGGLGFQHNQKDPLGLN